MLILYYGMNFIIGGTGANRGEQAPDFETELIDGSSFKLSDLRGKYVLLDFWGSWCAPCRASNPNLVKLHNKYGNNKLTVVTVALEKSMAKANVGAEQDGFTWKHQIVEKHKLIMFSKIARLYGVSEIPAVFLIDPSGQLLEEMSFDDMDRLLSE